MNIVKPHLSLNVSSIDASVAFYEKLFGVPVTKRRPGYAKFDLREPSLNLSMVEAPRTGLNASHFGVQVASSDDVAAASARFEEAGFATRTEQDTSCCYALQDKVWVEDPDGNAWEVFVVKGDTDQMRCDPTTGACVPPPPSRVVEDRGTDEGGPRLLRLTSDERRSAPTSAPARGRSAAR